MDEGFTLNTVGLTIHFQESMGNLIYTEILYFDPMW